MRRLNRNFSLLDAMVLIAATAVGLAIDRYYWSKVPLWAGPMRWPLRGFIAAGIIFSAPLAGMFTIAVLALQLRRPRYRLRRLLRRPGTAACWAATTALALGTGPAVCALRLDWRGSSAMLMIGCGLPIMAGSAVAAVWMVSMIERRYRPAADWSDRLGRVIGLYWVACILALGWMLNL